MKSEPKGTQIKEKVDSSSEIKEDAVENLNLIVKLAEQIAELDNQAYDVFTKKRVGNRKKNKKFKKTKSRKENRRYSFEDEEYEDSELVGSRVSPNGRIKNVGLKIRQ